MRITFSDGRAVNVDVQRKHVKNMTLRIYPDGRVKVSAPFGVTDAAVAKFVRSRTAWVEGHINRRAERRTVSGAGEVRLLGQNYALEFLDAPKNGVEVTDDKVIVSVKEGSDKKAVLANWWKKTALEYFGIYVDKWMDKLAGTGIERPRVSVRKMRSMWGSCTSREGTIRYNYYLLCAPPAAVEYVVLHEIAHLPHPNHGDRFKAFLTKWMPDWKARRDLLKYETPYSDAF